jgi:puromycin-sensitive aminopeptidase
MGDPVDGESDLDRKLRGLLIGTVGVLGDDAEVQARCRDWFDAASVDASGIDPELISAATNVVAATGDAATYDNMRSRSQNATTPQEQLRHLFALAEFDDEALILATCEFAMSESVKTQNAPFLLRAAIANRHHGAAAWRFVRDHWDEANRRFPSNTIVRMVDSVKLLTSDELVAETAAFFAAHPIPQAAKTLEQILERQRVNAALRRREAQRPA